MTASSFEQRRFPRIPLRYPIKLRLQASGPRYLTGQTCNLSAGGAFVELLDARSPLHVGDRVALALPSHPGDMLLAADDAVPATVVRTAPQTPGLGLRFDQPITIALPCAPETR